MATSNVPDVTEHVQDVVSEVANSQWMQWLARAGYAAKGIVYISIGGLAALAAFNSTQGETTDRTGVLQNIAQQPYGWLLLSFMVVGLVGYALWNLVRAIVDVDCRGSHLGGRLIRFGYIFIGISYLVGALTAVRLLLNANHQSNDEVQTWTARLLNQPFGMWLVLAGAGVIAGIAVGQLWRALSANFAVYLHITDRDLLDHAWVVRLGRIGYTARSIVFGLIAAFLVLAALRHNPNEAKGVDAVLTTLTSYTYGTLLLALVAIGLLAYGIFAILQSRYRLICQRPF